MEIRQIFISVARASTGAKAMTAYTELKRLAEDAIDDSRCRHDFQMEVTPKVVLSMIDALDVQAGSIEAVQAANQRLAAERDKLRTQNQALREALKEARTIMVLHRDFLDLKSSATWQLAIDPIDEVLAQAEGEV